MRERGHLFVLRDDFVSLVSLCVLLLFYIVCVVIEFCKGTEWIVSNLVTLIMATVMHTHTGGEMSMTTPM